MSMGARPTDEARPSRYPGKRSRYCARWPVPQTTAWKPHLWRD